MLEDQCPEGNESTKALVIRFLEGSAHESYRAAFGMEHLDPDDIKMLVGEDDAAACEHFNDTLQFPESDEEVTWLVAYYEAGDFFFAVARRQWEPGQWGTGWSPVVIFDENLEALQAFAM